MIFVISEGDKAIIEACEGKGWRAKRMHVVKEFPGKCWSVSTVKRSVKTVKDNVSTAEQDSYSRHQLALSFVSVRHHIC
jgi:hypothetical protein